MHISDYVVKQCNEVTTTVTNTAEKKTEYFYCNSGYVTFSNCFFENIEMTKDKASHLLHSETAHLSILNCKFSNIKYSDAMIYLQTAKKSKDFHFTLISNEIYNCETRNSNGRIVLSHSQTNDVQNNYIYCNIMTNLAQAFYFYYTDDISFINNTIINAKCADMGSAIYTKEDGNGNTLQISNCVFSNCRGKRGSIIYINGLGSDINIEKSTFTDCKNLGNDGSFIRIGVQSGKKITFTECNFVYLESCSSYGGVGILIDDVTTDTFTRCVFKHINHNHNSIGGGALAYDASTDSSKSDLIIDNCTFYNTTDSHNGGAIYFNSKDKYLKVDKCYFEQTKSSMDGHSIYILASNTYTITVSDSHFTDCGSLANTYVININSVNFDFFNNEITFNDPLNSCGCIKSNKYQEHNYRNNLFKNAHVDFESNSAGIDESNSADSNKIEITNNIFDGISGPSEGRCFYVKYPKDSTGLIISGNIVQNCPAGGIFIKLLFETQINEFVFQNFQFINNSVSDVSYNKYHLCSQIYVQNPKNGNFGGEITLKFENCTFQNNASPKQGGALAYGRNQNNSYCKIFINNCLFVGNSAKEGGSALSLIVYQGCEITNSRFTQNKSETGSGSIYIETDFDCPNVNEKPTRSPTISISNCIFDDTEGKDAGIVINNSPNAPVSIQHCTLNNCGSSGHSINVQSNVQSTFIHNCTLNAGSGGVYVHSVGKIELSYNDFVKTSADSALSIESEDASETVSITQCLFDSCSGSVHSCFYISAQTDSFEFKDIIIQNSKLEGCENYIGSLNLKEGFKFTMTNFSFKYNSCSSLFGGGTGMLFSGISELTFNICEFSNNEAHQDKTSSRPLENSPENPYYNGDGGAIQIGCQKDTKLKKVTFNMCSFNNNKAFRHGGAIAIQTINEVDLIDCKFDENIANFNFESSGTRLFENHFHKKKEGRGGAIYLNPAAGCSESFTSAFTINNCELNKNNAHDGYAIYVEGDDPTTKFVFIKNQFTDNYNENNRDSDPTIIYGAVIATEICSITNDTLHQQENPENDNVFSYSNSIKVNELSCVDHSGRTPSHAFTESDYFPSDLFTPSISFSYSGSFSHSNEFTDSNHFTPSNYFPGTNNFTKSDVFSRSDLFTKSGSFSLSDHFTKSDYFSKSNQFTDSEKFSKSSKFTQSYIFSKSEGFTKSALFSESKHFSMTNEFSVSDFFTKSNQFSNSNKFTNSDSFSETGSFSKSDLFSYSRLFTKSDHFTESNIFSNSDLFSKSTQFSKSNQFSETDSFSKSGWFSDSGHFSETNEFTTSDAFTSSVQFSNSVKFTNSNPFSETGSFSKSDLFSNSDLFSKSGHFSVSQRFTNSNQFSNTKQFSNSNPFSETGSFTKTESFSESTCFTKSDHFSDSQHFTYSNQFSNTKQFSNSNPFSETGSFTNTESFSESTCFTESDHFSISGHFTESSPFSLSNSFSLTSKFSFSHLFSETKEFSLTSQFTNSGMFTESDTFLPSGKFSSSNEFSKTRVFSNSEKFSISSEFSLSESFSISRSFSDSFFFSVSKRFSESGVFSNSKMFSYSQKFSFSISFSTSDDFTISNCFTQSKTFMPTYDFSDSKKFSKTQHFSLSTLFTYSNEFSLTSSFSYSTRFTNSLKFSETSSFSKSKEFSHSKDFSPSHQFSASVPFSNSIQFSESISFSPSVEPIPTGEPKCEFFEDGNVTLSYDCKYTFNNDNKFVYVHVLSTNFTGSKDENEGGAVSLINCGILCNNTHFIDCVAQHGSGGGAIYINNSLNIENNATFIDLQFIRCIADYGGAVYLYSSSDLYDISFTRCYFESNSALLTKKPSNGINEYLFGGSALFLACKNSLVINCTFLHNKNGGAIKIYDVFESNKKRMTLENSENKISILGCQFEQNENSKSSIFYEEKNGNPIEVKDCNFKGKLNKGSHYIDGNFHNKEKIQISSCNFENDVNNSVNFNSINDFQIKVNRKGYLKLFSFNLYIDAGSIAIIALIFTFIAIGLILLYCSMHDNESQDLFINELKENSFSKEEKSLL